MKTGSPKSKLHLEVLLLREPARASDDDDNEDGGAAQWASYAEAHAGTAAYLHDNFDSIKHTPGALLYVNPGAAASKRQGAVSDGGASAAGDMCVVGVGSAAINRNVAHIRICELQAAAGAQQAAAAAAAATAGDEDTTAVASTPGDDDDGEDEAVSPRESQIVHLDCVRLVLHFYSLAEAPAAPVRGARSSLHEMGARQAAGKEAPAAQGIVGASGGGDSRPAQPHSEPAAQLPLSGAIVPPFSNRLYHATYAAEVEAASDPPAAAVTGFFARGQKRGRTGSTSGLDNSALLCPDSSIDSAQSSQVPTRSAMGSLQLTTAADRGQGWDFLLGDDDALASSAIVTALPCAEHDGLWENLIFDHQIKESLVRYAETIRLFSQKAVSAHVISWHGIILLCGPPGTGKTSLFKAFAQKLAVRWTSGGHGFSLPFPATFSSCHLVEIRCGALFTKWFGESAKLVSQLMGGLHRRVAAAPHGLVCVLIDEVESLTMSRAGAVSGNEPSDYLRVVNTILTHLDMLKSQPNVLILCTSNLESALDDAFRDRIDFTVHLTYPTARTICTILLSTIEELVRTGLVTVAATGYFDGGDDDDDEYRDASSEESGIDDSLGKRQTAAPRNTPHRKPRAAPLLANPLLLLQGPSYGPKIYALAEKCCADTDPAAPASTPAVTPLSVAETAARPPARRRVGGRHLRRLALLAFARRPGVAHSAAACTLDQFLAALEAEIDCAATAPLPPPPPSSAA